MVTSVGPSGSEIKIFGQADARTIAQLDNCLQVEEGAIGVLCADNHVGYSQPIGGAVAYREHISPSGVGWDIGCGNKVVKTDLLADDLDVAAAMDEIYRRVSFGVGRSNNDPVDHPVLDSIKEANFAPQRQLYDLAAKQLGTVGSGNHYVDLFVDEDNVIWIGVHFGSRGFGHKTAGGFLALSEGKGFNDHVGGGEMDSPPIVFHIETDLGQAYIEAMELAGAYAYAGRDVVVDTVLDILGAHTTFSVHNHHNFAWKETHGGEEFWVVRKGCTPAWPGQQGFVGATMGEHSLILEGTAAGADGLFSTVHGAGRVMSRTEAAGKRKKRWTCGNCAWVQPPSTAKPTDDCCPDCQSAGLRKRWVETAPGKIDFAAVKEQLKHDGIELRGAGADEAPGAYKRLHEVVEAHGATVKIVKRLRPIGVAMAGRDTFDPYKD